MADVKQWITVHPNGADSKGHPIPVMEGQSKGEAVKSFVNKHKSEVKELNKKSTDELKKEVAKEMPASNPQTEEEWQSLDPLYNIPEKYMKEANDFIKGKGWDKGEMKDAMFNRWMSDLNYFYGQGGRSASVLWAKDLNKHLALMNAINPKRYKEEVKKFRGVATIGDFKRR